MAGKRQAANRTISTASNLANLLPTGTVLSLEAILPTLTNSGQCIIAHKYLLGIAIAFNAIICFFSAFTDSYVDKDGKLCYGIATRRGLRIFGGKEEDMPNSSSHRLKPVDFLHAFGALLVFLCFAFSDAYVQNCYFYHASQNENAVVTNLPLLASVFTGFIFTCFPTTRKGVGYAEPLNYVIFDSNKNHGDGETALHQHASAAASGSAREDNVAPLQSP